jgi:phosphate transport system substrate-binding protein
MSDTNKTEKKAFVLNKETKLFIRGLLIGKVMTLVVIGGLLWWLLKPRLSLYSSASYSNQQGSDITDTAASAFKTVTDVPIGTFKYGGSMAWAPIRLMVDSQIQGDRPELQLHYVNPPNGSPGSSTGIRMLLDGQLDFAQSSRPLTAQEYAVARQRGFKLAQHQVGIDGIAVVVNPSLKVAGLTIDQLRQIYLGQITNWKQVGGPDLPITPFSHPLEDTVLFSANGKQALSPNVQYANSTTEALRLVSKTPGGVYYASARGLVPQCSVKPLPIGRTSTQLIPPYREPLVPSEQCPHQRNQLNTKAFRDASYPMTTNLFVITKLDLGREQQVGEAYAKLLLTEQGQKAIAQAGFVRVR